MANPDLVPVAVLMVATDPLISHEVDDLLICPTAPSLLPKPIMVPAMMVSTARLVPLVMTLPTEMLATTLPQEAHTRPVLMPALTIASLSTVTVDLDPLPVDLVAVHQTADLLVLHTADPLVLHTVNPSGFRAADDLLDFPTDSFALPTTTLAFPMSMPVTRRHAFLAQRRAISVASTAPSIRT